MPAKSKTKPLSQKTKIAERLKKARESEQVSQQTLAMKAGISRSAVVHYEQGKAVPGGLELIKLAKALRLSPNYILSGSDAFFESKASEHALATEHKGKLTMRMTLCLMALDREIREPLSALLMALLKAKLSKEDYKGMIAIFETMDETMPDLMQGVEQLMSGVIEEKIISKLKKKLPNEGEVR